MKHPMFVGGFGMALAFGGSCIALPSVVSFVATAAGPLLLGIGAALIYLACKQMPSVRQVKRCWPACQPARNTIRPFARVAQ
jgi:protein-S-isoprenylcysteine O-methyltransferase Ste14